jgi:hypothetical protein
MAVTTPKVSENWLSFRQIRWIVLLLPLSNIAIFFQLKTATRYALDAQGPGSRRVLVRRVPKTIAFEIDIVPVVKKNTNQDNHAVPMSPVASVKEVIREEQPLKIDVISVGSLTKPEYQDAQQRTFGRLPMVRNFFRINELNDSDQDCSSKLTMENMSDILTFCRNGPWPSFYAERMILSLYYPNNHACNTGKSKPKLKVATLRIICLRT